MKNKPGIILYSIFLLLVFSCKNSNPLPAKNESSPLVTVRTADVFEGGIENFLSLNGKTVNLDKYLVLSPITGYITKIYTLYGDKVQKNDLLFEIQTKENKALENLGDSLSKNGILKVFAPSSGIINDLPVNQAGLFVTEGTPLCTITESDKLLVRVSVPYEYISRVTLNSECRVILPDQSESGARVYKILPLIDDESQTQNVLLKLNTLKNIPENLNLKVQFSYSRKAGAKLLPKEAILTNEIQSEFWVMKMVNDSLAVKKSILKGIENDSLIEVVSDEILPGDKVIIEGAYGLPDSAFVKYAK